MSESLIYRSPVGAFFVLVYALSWILILPWSLSESAAGLGLLPYTLPDVYGIVMFVVAPLGPVLGADPLTVVRQLPHPTSPTLTGSLVEGGLVHELGLEPFRIGGESAARRHSSRLQGRLTVARPPRRLLAPTDVPQSDVLRGV